MSETADGHTCMHKSARERMEHMILAGTVGTTASAIVMCVIFPEALNIMLRMNEPGTITVGTMCVIGIGLAPTLWRRKMVGGKEIGFWLLWCVPAVIWTWIDRYTIGSGAELLVIVLAAGAPTALAALEDLIEA